MPVLSCERALALAVSRALLVEAIAPVCVAAFYLSVETSG